MGISSQLGSLHAEVSGLLQLFSPALPDISHFKSGQSDVQHWALPSIDCNPLNLSSPDTWWQIADVGSTHLNSAAALASAWAS